MYPHIFQRRKQRHQRMSTVPLPQVPQLTRWSGSRAGRISLCCSCLFGPSFKAEEKDSTIDTGHSLCVVPFETQRTCLGCTWIKQDVQTGLCLAEP